MEKSKRKGGSDNIKPGFRVTGIHRRNVEEPLKHLYGTEARAQHTHTDIQQYFDSTLIEMLSQRRALDENKEA